MKTINKTQNRHRIVLFPSAQLKPGERKLVEIDRVEIAIVNIAEKLYAFRNACPHQGVSMIYGSIGGTMLPSEPTVYQYGCENEIVSCPLHGWEFDLKTGNSIFAPDKVSLLTYDIHEEDGNIVMYVKRKPEKVIIKEFQCNRNL
ncbi:Rieske (2Fe-2S) protein [Bacillus rubiinfantis]|uniref:Rieske (2Fe-2S) protein n=1 Tax=Bacillus rubiinfantis TaxID=1499680 RepID=UPI0006942173|nr:Rieske (2Fe-2S) protein [Bacillus rubiinfantis]